MPADSDGKKRKRTFIYFHDIIKTQDGSYFCVGEKYRKTASAAGITGLLMGNTANKLTQLTITDAVFFQFDKDFKLQSIKQMRKGKSRVQNAFDFGSPQRNAHLLKAWGAFDYEFTQIDTKRDRFFSTFIDFERIKGSQNRFAYKSIMYQDGKFIEDKLYLQQSRNGVFYHVLPAKIGHVMVMEFNKKKKTLDIHLEKLNI